jgi:hypothetical protein
MKKIILSLILALQFSNSSLASAAYESESDSIKGFVFPVNTKDKASKKFLKSATKEQLLEILKNRDVMVSKRSMKAISQNPNFDSVKSSLRFPTFLNPKYYQYLDFFRINDQARIDNQKKAVRRDLEENFGIYYDLNNFFTELEKIDQRASKKLQDELTGIHVSTMLSRY